MPPFQEIEHLKHYLQDCSIIIEQLSRDENNLWVSLKINDNCWTIYVDDEYAHFDEKKQTLALYLVINSLELYKESVDFLAWSKETRVNASEQKWLEYYQSLATIYSEIEVTLGEINSHVSCYDYQLQTALGKALLTCDN